MTMKDIEHQFDLKIVYNSAIDAYYIDELDKGSFASLEELVMHARKSFDNL